MDKSFSFLIVAEKGVAITYQGIKHHRGSEKFLVLCTASAHILNNVPLWRTHLPTSDHYTLTMGAVGALAVD